MNFPAISFARKRCFKDESLETKNSLKGIRNYKIKRKRERERWKTYANRCFRMFVICHSVYDVRTSDKEGNSPAISGIYLGLIIRKGREKKREIEEKGKDTAFWSFHNNILRNLKLQRDVFFPSTLS